MKDYLLALDQGTSSSRAIIFNRNGVAVASAQQEFTQYFPYDGWVEHDALEIWHSQLDVARQALAKSGLSAEDINAIGITNQRETVVLWDKSTGTPLYNAIVWQDKRTADYCLELQKNGKGELIRQKTGLLIDAYFSATKIKWLLDHLPQARERAVRGEICCGTVDSWLLYNLTGGAVHATDYTNASRTMLFNIHSGCYDEELLDLFDIPAAILPEVKPSSCHFGTTELFGAPIIIGGIAGDQQAALFGHGCFEPGSTKNTYGTGCFLLMNTGEEAITSQNGLLTTVAYNIDGKTTYALEGSVFNAGSAVQWLRDELQFFESSADSYQMALKVPDTGGVYVVPAFSGLGAPYWDMYARGVICGITRNTNKYHITRAVLEGIAFQTEAVLRAMEQDCGYPLCDLQVDGGASANDFLMQFQADILNISVLRPHNLEVTALGAAYLAGLATGCYKDKTEILKTRNVDRIFRPEIDESERFELLKGWQQAVKKSGTV